jgi:hypothetical protein
MDLVGYTLKHNESIIHLLIRLINFNVMSVSSAQHAVSKPNTINQHANTCLYEKLIAVNVISDFRCIEYGRFCTLECDSVWGFK